MLAAAVALGLRVLVVARRVLAAVVAVALILRWRRVRGTVCAGRSGGLVAAGGTLSSISIVRSQVGDLRRGRNGLVVVGIRVDSASRRRATGGGVEHLGGLFGLGVSEVDVFHQWAVVLAS